MEFTCPECGARAEVEVKPGTGQLRWNFSPDVRTMGDCPEMKAAFERGGSVSPTCARFRKAINEELRRLRRE